ncbi:MAG TPA: CocE/NonD family hydrolase, partial [Solirubrobacteraceae bacterium]|nr:CocE/NonD family hydrolase [Solirubrobacteraceae bacterium]
MSRPSVAAVAAALVLAAVPAHVHAQEPRPFGHACTPQDGVRVCPTTGLDDRVPSWDGTPIDVDVTLPAEGDGPFPTLLLLHGLGGTKTSFLEPSAANPGYDARSFARSGYAVVTPTARGFGNSCGRPESRTAGCEAGWTRLADMRYEVRDLQTLVGRLVDEGVARPDAIGSTGVSYGGGMSMMLAFLKDRVRLPDGSFAGWTSPNGTPISLAAAWPRWLWSNGEGIFIRTGRDTWTRKPVGVPTPAYAGGIFLVAFSGFVAPETAELTANLRRWKADLDRGTLGAAVAPTLDMAYDLHGVAGLAGRRYPAGGPAALLMQSGWTDALFPVGHSISAYRAIRERDPQAPVSLQLADVGHAPAANDPADNALFNAQGSAFLDSRLKGIPGGPAAGAVTAVTMRCPDVSHGGTVYQARNLDRLAPRTTRFRRRAPVTITHRGAGDELAAELNPLGASASHCTRRSADRSNRRNTFGARSRGVTLLGRPVITGRVRVRGRFGQMIARLWDLDPRTGEQRLITRGAYRFARH